MRTHTKEQLNVIIENHLSWLRGDASGEMADLSRADLSEAVGFNDV